MAISKIILLVIVIIVGHCESQVMSGGEPVPYACIEKLLPCQAYLEGSAATTKPAAACCVPLKEMAVSNTQCLCTVFNDPSVLKTLNVTQDDALNLAKSCAVNADISICSKEAAPPASIPAAPSTNNSEASAPPKKNAGTAVSHALLPAFILGFIVSLYLDTTPFWPTKQNYHHY